MKLLAKAALGALLLAGASVASPAAAQVDFGISFGLDGPVYGFDPCDYYDYYDEAPPWGLPDDYCDYPVWFEPVYFGGNWYRGPIYYRWTHGRRMFWLNGGWREDGRRGPPPPHIAWRDRGAHVRGMRPGFHGGDPPFGGGPHWSSGFGGGPHEGPGPGPGPGLGHGGGSHFGGGHHP